MANQADTRMHSKKAAPMANQADTRTRMHSEVEDELAARMP